MVSIYIYMTVPNEHQETVVFLDLLLHLIPSSSSITIQNVYEAIHDLTFTHVNSFRACLEAETSESETDVRGRFPCKAVSIFLLFCLVFVFSP